MPLVRTMTGPLKLGRVRPFRTLANARALARAALDDALSHRHPAPGLLHQTDQGSPYGRDDYHAALVRGASLPA
jgi:transposase InsO family protein